MALRVKEDNFEEEVLKSKLPVLVEFYSDSCIPCKQMSVILSELEEEQEDTLKIVKVNVNFSSELAEQYQVLASPTILFFNEEKVVHRVTGLIKKPILKELIESKF
jgi:thioredoxin 1